MHPRKHIAIWIGLTIILILVFLLDILSGSVSISLGSAWDVFWGDNPNDLHEKIIWQLRFPKAITAILAGIALSVSGLLLQTLLQNPLAGPSVLGITAGGSLGVAAIVLGSGSALSLQITNVLGLGNMWLLVVASIIGSVAVMLIILYLASRMYSSATLLIVGLMIANITMAIVGIWQYFSRPEEIYSYLVWSFGNLGSVQLNQLWLIITCVVLGIFPALLSVKGLDLLQLDESHAQSMGVQLKKIRLHILTSIGLLAGVITAFCGPIGFVGIAIPHLTRAITGFHRHIQLLPACALIGAITLLICDWASRIPGYSVALPINAMTALIGSPVVIWVLLKKSIRG